MHYRAPSWYGVESRQERKKSHSSAWLTLVGVLMSYCVSSEIRDQRSFGSIHPSHFIDEEKTFDQSWPAAELEPESGLMSDGAFD